MGWHALSDPPRCGEIRVPERTNVAGMMIERRDVAGYASIASVIVVCQYGDPIYILYYVRDAGIAPIDDDLSRRDRDG